LLHCISTFNKWQGCFSIVQSLSKLFHLSTELTGSSLVRGFK
jgi:hypothetical protein